MHVLLMRQYPGYYSKLPSIQHAKIMRIFTAAISCEGGGRLHLSRQGGMDDGDSDGESTNVQDPTAVLQSLLSEQLQPSPPQPLSPMQLPPLRADSGYESRNLSRHQSIQSPQDPGKKAW